jgi:hypothetical protein
MLNVLRIFCFIFEVDESGDLSFSMKRLLVFIKTSKLKFQTYALVPAQAVSLIL